MKNAIKKELDNSMNGSVLVISAWLPGGGIEKVLINLLSNPQFEDTFVLSLSTFKKYNWEAEISNNIKFEKGFTGSNSSIFHLIKGVIKSYNIIKKIIFLKKPKYIFFSHSFLLPIFVILNTNCKIYFWPQNSLFYMKNNIRSKLRYVFYKFFSSSIEGVLCVNKQILKEASLVGFKKNKLVYNPIGETFSNLFTFKPKMNKLVHIGYLDSRKNTSFIIQALSLSSNKEITLDIIGEGDLLKDLILETELLGLKDRVSFKGFVDLNNTIISCSGLIMASKSEGFSMIISDALKSGIPVFLPENLDISSYVKPRKHGAIFNLNNTATLVSIMDDLNFNYFNNDKISNDYINFFGDQAYCNRINS